MQAVILAAGSGTRLNPFTKNKPKALINLAGIPLLQFTFDQLITIKPKIKEFILVVNHHQDKIKDYFQNSYQNIPITETLGKATPLATISKYSNYLYHSRKTTWYWPCSFNN